ncbi:hypothetical protein D3C72_532470 [compost metagenome]
MYSTIFALLLASTMSAAMAQAPIYKCVSKGKTIYSESPCAIGTNKQSTIDTTPQYMGNETYDKETINAARARIRAGMDERGKGIATADVMPIGAGNAARNASPAQRADMCRWVYNETRNLDSWARAPQGGYSHDWIRQRKAEVQRTAYDWGC